MTSRHRIEKVSNLIQEVLGEIISREFTPPEGAIVSLTGVSVSGNLQEAKVYISAIPDGKCPEIVSQLEKNVRFFQEGLNKKLRMRPVPKITFLADKQPQIAQEVETILEKIKESEKH